MFSSSLSLPSSPHLIHSSLSVVHSSLATCLFLTINSGLQTDEGLHLMKILARRAKLQMTDFSELSYV